MRAWRLCGRLALVVPPRAWADSLPAGHGLAMGGGVWEFVAPLLLAFSSLLLVVGVFVFWNRRLKDEVWKRAAAERSLRRSNELLQCIDELRTQFIRESAPSVLFPNMLEHLLALTGSRFGFIGDVLTDPDGSRYLKVHALGATPGDEAGGGLIDEYRRQGFELREPHNLLGTALVTGKPVVANHLAADTASLGLPPGLPRIAQ